MPVSRRHSRRDLPLPTIRRESPPIREFRSDWTSANFLSSFDYRLANPFSFSRLRNL